VADDHRRPSGECCRQHLNRCPVLACPSLADSLIAPRGHAFDVDRDFPDGLWLTTAVGLSGNSITDRQSSKHSIGSRSPRPASPRWSWAGWACCWRSGGHDAAPRPRSRTSF